MPKITADTQLALSFTAHECASVVAVLMTAKVAGIVTDDDDGDEIDGIIEMILAALSSATGKELPNLESLQAEADTFARRNGI